MDTNWDLLSELDTAVSDRNPSVTSAYSLRSLSFGSNSSPDFLLVERPNSGLSAGEE
jgi:hypothetical protein